MRVRKNNGGDWSFGRGRADYVKDNEAIKQNVETRLKSFKNDWFLDIDANIDWFGLLGRKGTQAEIEREIERVTLATEGVLQVNKLQLTKHLRSAKVHLEITTIFNDRLTVDLGLEP
jgi:hypothetical protein